MATYHLMMASYHGTKLKGYTTMTFKDFYGNMSYGEQSLFAEKLYTWLSPYTDEVIKRVYLRLDDIVNDQTALHLIDELYARTQRQAESNKSSFRLGLDCYGDEHNSLLEYGIHGYSITHPSSYRDVLYDMYIG